MSLLTSKGYAIRKATLTVDQERLIRKELTVAPVVQGAGRFASAKSEPFAVYFESQERFYLPRHWAREHFGPEEGTTVPEGIDLPTSITFTGKPFDYQVKVINDFLEKGANGLICVPCGRGKTFMSLAIAAKLGKRFLVVVDKEFLLNQWKGEIQSFFPGLRIGILQGAKCETDPAKYDVTLCMIQTLVQKEFPDAIFRSYGLAIFDECHHLGAQQFSRALLKIQTKYMLGLSATPTRDDGLTKVFEWYIGKPVYWEKIREPDTSVIVKAMFYTSDDKRYTNEPKDYMGNIVTATLLGQIMDFEPRNEWIGETLCALTDDPKRRILVLSQYKRHLQILEAILKRDRPEVEVSYYIGGMKEAIREEGARNARVILGSYAMASEAMNIKTLNCVILASPRKKIEQSVGRIFRQRPEDREIHPLILDVIDSHGLFLRQYTKRRVFYTQCKYTIERIFHKKEQEEEHASDNEENLTDSEEEDEEQEQTSPKKKTKKSVKRPGKKEVVYDFVEDE